MQTSSIYHLQKVKGTYCHVHWQPVEKSGVTDEILLEATRPVITSTHSYLTTVFTFYVHHHEIKACHLRLHGLNLRDLFQYK